MDLVLFEGAGIIRRLVLQVEMDPLSRIHLDGPVAPQRWVGAEVVWGEKLTIVAMQQLVAAPQGEESPVITSVSICGRNRPTLEKHTSGLRSAHYKHKWCVFYITAKHFPKHL